jgi:hypothetical protein
MICEQNQKMADRALELAGECGRLKSENEAIRGIAETAQKAAEVMIKECDVRAAVADMPWRQLLDTFNATYYAPREDVSDEAQCRAAVLAVIDVAVGQVTKP